MQAGFWLAPVHPAVTPSPSALHCARCGAAGLLLASFCARCGADLRPLLALPTHTDLAETWNQAEDEPIECLLGNHGLLAALRQTGRVDLWSPYQLERLCSLPIRAGVEAAALLDNLLVTLYQNEVEVHHLTPHLRGDACRFDRNHRFQTTGSLNSPLANSGKRLSWLAGSEILCHRIVPNGLQPAWRQPWKGECLALAWSGRGLWVLQHTGLQLLASETGERLLSLELPAPALSLCVSEEDVWVCGQQGELWLYQGGTLQRNWPGHQENCFSFAAGPTHVIQCSGRRLRVLDRRSGRQRLLEVPQPCVLPPVLGPQWAVLVSYEGMVYHLALDQEQPRVAQARRPFSSFEPIMITPVLAGRRLFLAGPEGQLAGWHL